MPLIARIQKHVFFFLVLCLIIPLAFGCSAKFSPAELAGEVADLDEVIEITHGALQQPVDVVLSIDQSASMSGHGNYPPTDPDEWRVKASHYLVSNIAAKCTAASVPRIGVVHFGTDAPIELQSPLTYMRTEQDVLNLNARIKAMDLVWTNFFAALKAANDQFMAAGTYAENRKAAVILFTDGEPSDPRKLSPEAYFREIGDFIKENFTPNGVDLFVIGLDAADMLWSDYESNWRAIMPTAESTLFHLSEIEDLSQVYNEIVRSIYKIPDVPPDVVSTGRELAFDLPAYLERVEFHVFPETGELALNITKPDGTAVSATDPGTKTTDYGLYSIIVVNAPEPGRWTYRVERGQGQVEVYRNMIPVRLRLISPRPQELLGTEKEIRAEFNRQDGTALEVQPDYPIQVELAVSDPGGRKEQKILNLHDPGISGIYTTYTAETPFQPEAEGRHEITLTVHAAGAFSYADHYVVEVLKLPYLAPVSPQPGDRIRTGSQVQVEVALHEGSDAVANPADYFETPATALIIAWLETEGQERSEAHYIHPTEAGGHFDAVLPYKVSGGKSRVCFRIVGHFFDGEPYSFDELVVDFTGVVPWWYYALPVMLVLFFIGGATKLIFYLRRPFWTGCLTIEKKSTAGFELVEEIFLGRFGRKKQLRVGPTGDIKIGGSDYPWLSGKLWLQQRDTELGTRHILVFSCKEGPGEPEALHEFIMEGDIVYLGPYVFKYYWL